MGWILMLALFGPVFAFLAWSYLNRVSLLISDSEAYSRIEEAVFALRGVRPAPERWKHLYLSSW